MSGASWICSDMQYLLFINKYHFAIITNKSGNNYARTQVQATKRAHRKRHEILAICYGDTGQRKAQIHTSARLLKREDMDDDKHLPCGQNVAEDIIWKCGICTFWFLVLSFQLDTSWCPHSMFTRFHVHYASCKGMQYFQCHGFVVTVSRKIGIMKPPEIYHKPVDFVEN